MGERVWREAISEARKEPMLVIPSCQGTEGMREVAATEIDHGSALHGHLLNEYAIALDALGASPVDSP
jgi:hypothetical protein